MRMPGEVVAALVGLGLVFGAAGLFFPPAAARSGAGQAPGPTRGVGRRSGEPSAPPGARLRVLLADETVVELDLEDYVQGVVTAEMPASFEPAALEAQAVCARTYALSRARAGTHGEVADVCADPGCCQAYTAQDGGDWGDKADLYRAKLRAAVAATAGQVLRWDGQLISAVFHASSEGKTAPAQAVWGSAVPYLVSVSTPETADAVPSLESDVALTAEELRAAFLEKYPQADLSGPPETWFTDLERGDWGGVERLCIGGVDLTGGQVRSLFGLRSARFTLEPTDDGVIFHVSGYGHGVGMSQQGANLLAKEGYDCRAILAHYYPGTTLGPM